MAEQQEPDVDSIVNRLLEVRGSRPGKQVDLAESEIRFLCTKAREIFIQQPILLELEAPIKVSLLFYFFQFFYLQLSVLFPGIFSKYKPMSESPFAGESKRVLRNE